MWMGGGDKGAVPLGAFAFLRAGAAWLDLRPSLSKNWEAFGEDDEWTQPLFVKKGQIEGRVRLNGT